MRKSKGNSEAFFPAGSAPRKWLPGSWAASRRLALSVTANAVPAPPKGEPSKQPARGLQKAKSCLPLWGRWTRVSEDGEGSPPEACRRPSLASPFGGGGLALARTERAARQRLAEGQVSPPPLGGAGAQWAPFSAWSPLPRRSVMDAAHWAASPEPAGESAPAGGGEGSPPAAPPQNNPCLP